MPSLSFKTGFKTTIYSSCLPFHLHFGNKDKIRQTQEGNFMNSKVNSDTGQVPQTTQRTQSPSICHWFHRKSPGWPIHYCNFLFSPLTTQAWQILIGTMNAGNPQSTLHFVEAFIFVFPRFISCRQKLNTLPEWCTMTWYSYHFT